MTETIIITAGGKGLRMGTEIPKQFLLLNDKPILLHTIERFYDYNTQIQIILVLPDSQISYWQFLLKKYKFQIPHLIVTGGKTRYHSVKNGVAKATGNLVGVHDAVRPLVSIHVIEKTYASAKLTGAAIPVLSLKESVRKVNKNGSKSVNRDFYKSVQTPQCFNGENLKQAYSGSYQPTFTDDASVVEFAGHNISLVEGNEENIKITTPFDLKISEFLLNLSNQA